MIRQKEVYSCEHESESFLGKTDEEGIEFKKKLKMCFDNGSHLKGLMVRSSREILETPDLKTNVLYVNAGNTEAGQLSHVVIEDGKRKAWVFQERREDFYNPVRKEKEQLSNTIMEGSVNIGQLWKVEAK